jgi:RNA 2',3'-cyclic 3'-phosphodiesterase
MRTFIAIKIKAEPLLIKIVADIKNQLEGESLTWVDIQNLHLTLKFLGETSGQQIQAIKKEMSDIAARYQPFPVLLKGLDSFKSGGMPRVLFAGIYDDGTMAHMAGDAGEFLVSLGFEKEMRPFKPHLTLARIKYLKNKKRFFDLVDKYRNLALQQSTVTEIILFQSLLNPSGPVYHELAVVPLA